MLRPHKMRHLEFTVLERDLDSVLAWFGKKSLIHFTHEMRQDGQVDSEDVKALEEAKKRYSDIEDLARWLAINLEGEIGEDTELLTDEDIELLRRIQTLIDSHRKDEIANREEGEKLSEAVAEAAAFEKLKAPFADFDQLSYMALRIGRLDARHREEAQSSLGDRAVLVSLGEGDRVLAASSRKGRFALDSELKRVGFVPISVPQDFTGIPDELLDGLKERLEQVHSREEELASSKENLKKEYASDLRRLAASSKMSLEIKELRSHLQSTASACRLSGWMPAAKQEEAVKALEELTEGRVAIVAREPEERKGVASGKEKVPVSIEHGGFVGGFIRMVFSYGAPLYGNIDPTPFVAFSFVLLFGLMFGDVGQGFVLLLLGFLTARKSLPFFGGFSRFSAPLKGVGISSMCIGLLNGEVFANEHLLVRPTRFITGLLTGHEMDRIISLMPEKGNMDRLFVFFGFTIAVGILLNSIGLIINILNLLNQKKVDDALFSKTGLSGALFFWWAVGLAVRVLLGFGIGLWDVFGFGLPLFFLVTGHVWWRLFTGVRPVFEHGFLTFAMEGFVEILESVSSYVSNSVSFLRVGAFALSHAVLSFIVFTLANMVAGSETLGPLYSFLVMFLGNTVIIVLEGLIVAIQVVRLQYYEFFSKFFTDTGIEFDPFRFRKEVSL